MTSHLVEEAPRQLLFWLRLARRSHISTMLRQSVALLQRASGACTALPAASSRALCASAAARQRDPLRDDSRTRAAQEAAEEFSQAADETVRSAAP